MSHVNEKKLYIWRLAAFLYQYDKQMSGGELADHLNRNNFLTEYGEEYQGGRGTFTLIKETWRWVNDDLGLSEESKKIAESFVNADGEYAYE